MNKNYVLDLGNRHDIINTFERSFSSVLNKRRLFQLGMIASDERKGTSMYNAHIIAHYMQMERDIERHAKFIQHWKERIKEWKKQRNERNDK